MSHLALDASLSDFFGQRVRDTLDDLELSHVAVAGHLTALLVRFASVDVLAPQGRGPLPGVSDVHREIAEAWRLDGPRFDPAREMQLRRWLGDYTLFTLGFFWERARAHSMARHLSRVGRHAYRFVAEHERALDRPEAGLYRVLAERFDRYAGALTYLREVYLDADFAPWPHPTFARVFRWG